LASYLLAQDSAFVHLTFNAETAYLVVDNDFEEILEIKTDTTIPVLAGTRYISLGIPNDQVQRFYLQIPKDSTVTREVIFPGFKISSATFNNNFASAQYYQANMMILSEPDTEIFYTDSLMGTGFAIINSEDRFPTFRLVDNLGRVKNVEAAQTGQFTVIEKYVRPEKYASRTMSFIPGASQFYKRQPLKGSAFILGTLGFTSLYIIENSAYKDEEIDYFNGLDEYRITENEETALILGDQLERQANTLNQMDNRRRLYLSLALLTYAANIYDAFTSTPRGGFSDPKPFDFYIQGTTVGGSPVSTATLKFNLDKLK